MRIQLVRDSNVFIPDTGTEFDLIHFALSGSVELYLPGAKVWDGFDYADGPWIFGSYPIPVIKDNDLHGMPVKPSIRVICFEVALKCEFLEERPPFLMRMSAKTDSESFRYMLWLGSRVDNSNIYSESSFNVYDIFPLLLTIYRFASKKGRD
jgi:hypothetical protein